MEDVVIAEAMTSQMVADQMVTAIEGGANHWLRDFLLVEGTPSDEIWYAGAGLYSGDFKLKLVELEGEEHEITPDKLKSGIEKLRAEHYDRYFEIVDESGDAETADVFLQVILFGEIVYG